MLGTADQKQGIKKYLKENKETLKLPTIILVLYVIVLGSIGFDFLLGMSLIRGVFSVPFLLFVPGYLILINLKIKKLNILENILFSIGLSLSFIVMFGLFINTLSPSVGIEKPLSEVYVIPSFLIVIFALWFFAFKNKRFSTFNSNLTLNLRVNEILLITLLPCISILGTLLAHFYNFDILIFVLYLIIGFTPLLVYLNFYHHESYPLLLFAIGISILYSITLQSMYIFKDDIHIEFYFANLANTNSYWNPNIGVTYNSIIINVLGMSLFSKFSGINLNWIYKLVYPVILALVPVGIYQVCNYVIQGEHREKISFFGSCVFLFSMSFFTILNIKQRFAEFFLILLIILIFNKNIEKYSKSILAVILSISLVFSHYGVSFLFIFLLIFTLILIRLNNMIFDDKVKLFLVTPTFSILFSVIAISWYMYCASGSPFRSLVGVGNRVINSLSEIFYPLEKSAVDFATRELELSWQITRGLYFIFLFFILVAYIYFIIQKFIYKKLDEVDEGYFYLSLHAGVLLLISIILPYTFGKGAMDFHRAFHYTQIFLVPFIIIGEEKLIGLLTRFRSLSKKKAKIFWLKNISLLLVIFFLFNSSFISEVIHRTYGGDYSINPALTQTRIETDSSIKEKIVYYGTIDVPQDVCSAKWLGVHKNKELKVFVDSPNNAQVLSAYGNLIPMIEEESEIRSFSNIDIKKLDKNSYIHFRTINIKYNIMQHLRFQRWWNTSEILPSLEKDRNKIYSNGGSVIYN